MASRKLFCGKKVFVTGATGFIGLHLVRRLVFEKANVHILFHSQKNLYRLRSVLPSVKCWKGDLGDRAALKKLIKRVNPQVIFHLAGFGVHSGQTDFLKLAEINILGLVNLLFSLQELEFDRFIYSGTSAEYGPSNMPMSERQIPDPVTFYGATKAAGTFLAQAFARVHHKKVVGLRPFYVYGPDEGSDRLVSTVIRRGRDGQQLKVTSLNEKRDFIYIDDVIDAYILAATKNIESPSVMNIGMGKESCLGDVIELVERKIGRKIKVEEGAYPFRPWKSSCWAADVSKAKKLLGWKPKYTLSEGIDKIIEWVRLINKF